MTDSTIPPVNDSGLAPVNLDQLETLARAATPGPWAARPHVDPQWMVSGPRGDFHAIAITSQGLDEPNARYIAAASPSVILQLTAELRKTRAERDVAQLLAVTERARVAELEQERDVALAQSAALAEALQFYANETNYRAGSALAQGCISQTERDNWGDRARRALERAGRQRQGDNK